VVSERRWRLAELARLGGVSEQQVRNYLAGDLLPPATRAANNYRRFTDRHADALRTVRALAAGHGWTRTRGILAAVLRTGHVPFPIIDAVIAALRSSGSVSRALAELSRRDEQVQLHSRLRLDGSAALSAYLAAYHR
jgi:DNA-binding transcriptional MerR regulator